MKRPNHLGLVKKSKKSGVRSYRVVSRVSRPCVYNHKKIHFYYTLCVCVNDDARCLDNDDGISNAFQGSGERVSCSILKKKTFTCEHNMCLVRCFVFGDGIFYAFVRLTKCFSKRTKYNGVIMVLNRITFLSSFFFFT